MDKEQFSESTKALLDELAKERDHRKWLAEILLRWAKWIAAIAAGITVVWDAGHRILSAVLGK